MLALCRCSSSSCSMLVEARRARAQRARAARARRHRAAGDVYRLMQVAYPGAFLAMLVEGAVRGAPPPAARRRRRGRIRRRQGAQVVGDPHARSLLDLPRHRRARRAAASRRGPYRFLRHPNYVGVIGELAGVALMTGAPVAGRGRDSWLFAALLVRRIAVEERALRGARADGPTPADGDPKARLSRSTVRSDQPAHRPASRSRRARTCSL